MAENGLGNAGRGGIARAWHLMVLESGELGACGDGMVGNTLGQQNGIVMIETAYLDFFSHSGGLGIARSQCLFTLAENSGLPLAMAVVGGLLLVWDPSISLIGS